MRILKEKSPERICYFSGLILIILSFLFSILQAKEILKISQLLPSCFFYSLTHLPCPGCGMTRAIQALFSLHIIDSFLYNPIVLYCAIFYAFFMISYTLAIFLNHFHKNQMAKIYKLHIIYIHLGILIMLVQWVVKLIYIMLSVIN